LKEFSTNKNILQIVIAYFLSQVKNKKLFYYSLSNLDKKRMPTRRVKLIFTFDFMPDQVFFPKVGEEKSVAPFL
jgi:hypothetical protein